MTLDASVLVAICRRSDGWEELVTRVMQDEHPRVPATALAEAGMLLDAQGSLLDVMDLSALVRELKLTVVPFTEGDWFTAVHEYHKRRGGDSPEPARFGNCLTAAVAARTGAAVLDTPASTWSAAR